MPSLPPPAPPPAAAAYWSRRYRSCSRSYAAWLERKGLLFGDAELEWEYLGKANYPLLSRIVGTVMCGLAASFFAFTLYLNVKTGAVSHDFHCKVGSIVTLNVAMTIATGLIGATWCSKIPKQMATRVQAAAAVFGFSLIAYIPYSLCDSNQNAQTLFSLLNPLFINITNNASQDCSDANLSLATHTARGNFSCFIADGDAATSANADDAADCTAFAALTMFARLYGFIYESFFMRVLVCWIAMQGLIVINFLPARIMMYGIPLGGLVLLSIVGEFTMQNTMSNLGGSITGAITCSRYIVVTVMSFFAEVTISLMAATAALVLQVIARTRLKRELFFWTKTLGVEMASLEDDANPFRRQALQKWLADARVRHPHDRKQSSASTGSVSSESSSKSNSTLMSVATHTSKPSFWDIPVSELSLKQQVAAGSAGSVWRAEYQGATVAAKRLKAMSDLLGLEEALAELMNEVRILGKLNHPNVVKMLGLCQDSSADDGVLQVFIIQEWCDRNLRDFLVAHSFLERAALLETDSSIASSETIAKELACGMKYLHDQEILHRDLKPENVLLTSTGCVRICDFGLSQSQPSGAKHAKATRQALASKLAQLDGEHSYASELAQSMSSASLLHSDSSMQSSSSAPVEKQHEFEFGTLLYMAPEIYAHFLKQTSCREELTTKADVYAFGLILWELFVDVNERAELAMLASTQYSPEEKDRLLQEDTHDRLTKQLQRVWQRPALSHLVQSCPEYIRQLIADCSSFPASSRPSFTCISVQLAAGPMREFAQAIHKDQRRLTSKSLRPRLLSSATSLMSAAVSAVRRSIGRARSRTRSDAHVVRPVRSGVGPARTEPKARTFATEPTRGTLSSSTILSAELQEIRAHSFTAPAAFKAKGSPHSTTRDPLDSTTDHLIEPNSELDVSEQDLKSNRRRTPSCHAKLTMAFPDRSMEQRFCEESLQSDAHYRIARWAFYLLSLLYFSYFSSSFAMRARFQLFIAEESDILRTIVVPLLNFLLFTVAAIFAHQKAWRRFAHLQLFLVVPIGVCACILVPWASYTTISREEGSLFNGGLFGDTSSPPDNSTFIDGWLQPASTSVGVCGGTGDARAAPTNASVISLCQTINYSASIGNLAFFLSSIPTLQGLTLPAILMLLALPLRWYLVAIAAPFAGMILQIVLAEHDLRVTREVANNILGSVNASDVRLTEEFNWLYLSVYTTVIYSSCLASAISNERFNRAVFIIQCALSDQRAALITERDSTRYRYILQHNRSMMARQPKRSLNFN